MLWLANILLQSTLLCVIAMVISRTITQRAAARYWILTAMLVLILLTPLTSAITQQAGWGLLAFHAEPDAPAENPSEQNKMASSAQPQPGQEKSGSSPNAALTETPLRPTAVVQPVLQQDLDKSSSGESPPDAQPLASPAGEAAADSAGVAVPTSPEPSELRSASVFPWFALFLGAVCVWAVGAIVVGIRFARALRRLAVITRQARTIADVRVGEALLTDIAAEVSASLRMKQTARVRLSDDLSTPIVTGMWQPHVLLPASLVKDIDAEQLREILTHEFAHVLRRDPFAVALQNLAAMCFWFHPLVRMVNWRISQAREEVCDNYVLNATDGRTYSRTLLRTAKLMTTRELFPAAVGIMGANWKLEKRVEGILDKRRSLMTRLSLRTRVLLAAIVCISILAISLATVTQAERGATPNAPADVNTDAFETKPAHQEVPSSDDIITVSGAVKDPTGQAAPDIEVRLIVYSEPIVTHTNAAGEFALEASWGQVTDSLLIAASADGSQQAYHRIEYDATPEQVSNIALDLQPARELTLNVVDEAKRPVAHALVGAMVSIRGIAEAHTDDSGTAILQVPADAPLSNIYAYHESRGFDYFCFEDETTLGSNPYLLPANYAQPVNLALNGLQVLTVNVRDGQAKPLAGVEVHPWYFEKPEKGDSINLSGLNHPFKQMTDADGVAQVFVPTDNQGVLTIWTRKDGYQAEERLTYSPASDPIELTATLRALVPMRGRVTTPDGKPAADIDVMVSGAGHRADRFMQTVRTDAQGKYEIAVWPDMYYQIVPDNRQWTAEAQSVVVRSTPVADLNFQLQPAIRVHGRFLLGDQPQAGVRLSLYKKHGGYHELPADQQLPNPTNSRTYISAMIIRHAQTEEDGQFEFRVGPGDYYILGPNNATPPEFRLRDDEAEYEVNMEAPASERFEITGRVVDAQDQTPVAKAIIQGKHMLQRARGFDAVSLDDGSFHAQRGRGEILVHAASPDGKLATIIEVAADQESVELALAPTSTCRGRLVDAETNQPLTLIELEYGIRTYLIDAPQVFSMAFGGYVKTDAEGFFEISGLVPGQEYRVNHSRLARGKYGEQRGSSREQARFTATQDPVELGDVKLTVPDEAGQAIQQPVNNKQAPVPDPDSVIITGTVKDAAGRPAADAQVRLIAFPEPIDTKSNAAGEFEFQVSKNRFLNTTLIAESRTGLMAAHYFPSKSQPGDARDVTLQLKPARQLSFLVRDDQGAPVAGAAIGALTSTYLAAEAVSDESGQATLRISEDLPLTYVYAYEQESGFDYFRFASELINQPSPYVLARNQATPIEFVLNGMKSVTVKTETPGGAPIPDAIVSTFGFEKPQKGGRIGLSGMKAPFVQFTNDAGLARFFVPADNVGFVTLFTNKDGFHAAERLSYDPKSSVDYLTSQMQLTVQISGKVSYPDGRPAAGIEVIVAGEGHGMDNSFRRTVRTNADGEYSSECLPNNYCQVVPVSQKDWAAASRLFVVREDNASGINFTLQPGTRVYGQLTDHEGKPAANESVGIILLAEHYYRLPEAERFPNPTNDRTEVTPSIPRWQQTDEQGKFEFAVGPGEYRLTGAGRYLSKQFTLKDEPEFVANLQLQDDSLIPIRGRIVNKATGEPVESASVGGFGSGAERGMLPVYSAADGTFTSQRGVGPILVRAVSADGKLSANVKLTKDQQTVEIELEPSITITGRLIDAQTGRPIANTALRFGTNDGNSTLYDIYGGQGTTDGDGVFSFSGLTVGQSYDLSLQARQDDYNRIATFQAERSEMNLGDIRVQPKR